MFVYNLNAAGIHTTSLIALDSATRIIARNSDNNNNRAISRLEQYTLYFMASCCGKVHIIEQTVNSIIKSIRYNRVLKVITETIEQLIDYQIFHTSDYDKTCKKSWSVLFERFPATFGNNIDSIYKSTRVPRSMYRIMY